MSDWMDRWLLKLNDNKCKVVSYGRNVPINANCNLKQCILAGEESYNDLGVKFNTKLKFDSHINEKINKAYSILGIIKRNFYYLSGDCFVTLYKSLVHSHLEYANCLVTSLSGIDKKN